jgi:glycosyltransferase involved in cell wall biosynthesis
MNILFVWTSPFKGAGGVGRVTTTLGPEFVRQGHKVAYLSLGSGDRSVDEGGITQYFCPDGESIKTEKNQQFVSDLLRELNIEIIINQSGIYPDILHFLNSVKPENVKILSVHHNCIRCLLEHHTTIVRENYRNHSLFPIIDNSLIYSLMKQVNRIKYWYYFRNCIKDSDKLVLLSEKFIPELDTYIKKYPKDKVYGIPNPAPFEAVSEQDLKKENRLVYVGRINFQQKRADRIIKIWRELYQQYPDWEFDVVGNGPALDQLKRMADKENLPRIHFHGYCNPEPYLSRAKIFTLTSDFEGFGMVLVEAQAYGAIPVAFRCFSAIEDIIEHGQNGLIVQPSDMRKYIQELSNLMSKDNMRNSMVGVALRSVSYFAPSEIANQWDELFNEVQAVEHD